MDGILAMTEQMQQNSGVSITADLMSLAAVVGMWKMFEKAGEPGWAALIPFYNLYKLCTITMAQPWYWVRFLVFLIPVIGWIAGFYFMYQMSKATALAFGKPSSWAWGYLFLAGVFYCITGFDSSEYYGPMGAGDNRTTQAKEAKTVNFDVVKDEPQPQYQDFSEAAKVDAAPAQKEEETVDFMFDQPEE